MKYIPIKIHFLVLLLFLFGVRSAFAECWVVTGLKGYGSNVADNYNFPEKKMPRRKNVLIDYEELQKYVGVGSYEQLKRSHKEWVEEYLGDGENIRWEEWTSSIAVGSRAFVEKLKALLGIRAKGRDVMEGDERYHLREGSAAYKALLGAENNDIGVENTYFWGVSHE